MKLFWVYMIASSPGGVLYIGVTSDLIRRGFEHRQGIVKGFTRRYHVTRLVWFEEYGDAENAILREKRLKEWKRSMKIDLIEKWNPLWHDLYPDLVK